MRLIDLSAPITQSSQELPEPLRTDIAFHDHGEGAAAIESMFGVTRDLLHDGEGWATEEFLRFFTPAPGDGRTFSEEAELDGVRFKEGERLWISWAMANRDPEVFPDPHVFDITRDNAGRHLSFSGGRHFCLGAALARTEGEVGLRTFFERYPNAALAGAGNRRDTRVLRGWSSLPIALGEARGAVRS